MVSSVTSLTGNGLKDWLIQRLTALYFAGYGLFLLTYFIMHPQLDYASWHLLNAGLVFKIATLFALVAYSLHAWIGLWTVITDYLSCTALRLFTQVLVFSWIFAQFIWGVAIIWRF